jgi:flagellar biosynthesis/type III secretory pathway chaperone
VDYQGESETMTAENGAEVEKPRDAAEKTPWESELASFLTDLSKVQGETLQVLTRKRQCLVGIDTEGLTALAAQEQQVIDHLDTCLQRRAQLLQKAEQEGLPSDSIESLTDAIPPGKKRKLGDQVKLVSGQTRLLRHHSLTNWVVVQRTLLHLSQMIEIIATGGKKRPTYSKEVPRDTGGALVDRVA